MYNNILFQPRYREHLKMLIRAQGLPALPPKGSSAVEIKTRHLNIETGNYPSIRFHSDVAEWISESGLDIRIGGTPDCFVAYGDEDAITLFTLKWL